MKTKVCHVSILHHRYDIRIFHKECVTLSNLNYEVSLIVCDDLANEIINDVSIYSVGKYKNKLERFLQYQNKIWLQIRSIHPDIVHFHDPELVFLGAKLVKLGYKVIYDVHEDLPKQIMYKYWIPKLIRRPLSIIAKLIEHFYIKKFNGVITSTSIIKNRVKKYNSIVSSIANYPLLEEVNLSRIVDKEDAICYIGSISRSRGIVPLVESLEISKIKLKLAGVFSGDICLEEIKKLPGGEYVEYLGVLNRSQISQLLNTVKVGIVTLLPTPSYIESMPIKMFEYMMFKIPIVASNFIFWKELLADNCCGLFVNPNDKIEIATACNFLINNESESRIMGLNGYNAIIKKYNWEKESNKLKDFYIEINR